MRIKPSGSYIFGKTCFVKALALTLAASLFAASAMAQSPSHKRSKSDRNLNAIGHRNLAKGMDSYSLDQEKADAARLAAVAEKVQPILTDESVTAYIDGLALRIVRNSDARLPIAVRVVNTDGVDAVTISGGYQYITRGALQLLQNEGELASVLAHGIAHTALRSTARENILMTLSRALGAVRFPASDPTMGSMLTDIGFRQQDEFDADYFGIQYLYKSGYDPQCFLDSIQRLAKDSSYANPASTTFNTLPPAGDRVAALHKEVAAILPKKDNAITSTPEFIAFQEHLRTLPAPKDPETTTTLHRAQN
jgi:beta-barrel assembly-enhancing protease